MKGSISILIMVGILLLILIWAMCGFPASLPEDKTITVSSASMARMSEWQGPMSHDDCVLTDINGGSYHLMQDITSEYWCVSGWNRTEEIHAGQKYHISLQRSLFSEMKNIISIQRIEGV